MISSVSAVGDLTLRYRLLLAAIAAGILAVTLNTHIPAASHTESTESSAVPLKCLYPAALNSSNPGPFSSMSEGAALIHSSLKEFALSVFQPASQVMLGAASNGPCRTCAHSSAAHATHSPALRSESSAATLTPGDCRTWSDRLKLSKDLVLRPASTVHIFDNNLSHGKMMSKVSPPSVVPQGSEPQNGRALGTRALNSLSLKLTANALVEVVSKDLRVLYDAIDELLRAVGRQIEVLKNDWHAVRDRIRGLLTHRNRRAKENARKLRDSGGQFITSTGARLTRNARGMMEHARQRAKSVRKHSLKSDERLAEDRRRSERQAVKTIDSARKREERVERRKVTRRAQRQVPHRGREGVFGRVF